jgi:hypothetical protein
MENATLKKKMQKVLLKDENGQEILMCHQSPSQIMMKLSKILGIIHDTIFHWQ